ncbi:uncharacterized protein LOC130305947 [Hyla sarda]|uniref:uncharacterized protein LOC130305947 n=1 Tax=Hyla sarda TaxID=327740 RepID=UPI0024C22902|nr:uncharacterized protein LOC130305947 [Hyla sarda]
MDVPRDGLFNNSKNGVHNRTEEKRFVFAFQNSPMNSMVKRNDVSEAGRSAPCAKLPVIASERPRIPAVLILRHVHIGALSLVLSGIPIYQKHGIPLYPKHARAERRRTTVVKFDRVRGFGTLMDCYHGGTVLVNQLAVKRNYLPTHLHSLESGEIMEYTPVRSTQGEWAAAVTRMKNHTQFPFVCFPMKEWESDPFGLLPPRVKGQVMEEEELLPGAPVMAQSTIQIQE